MRILSLFLIFAAASLPCAAKDTPTALTAVQSQIQPGILSVLSDESQACIECHRATTYGIYQQWGYSKHYGGNVGCYECHKAEKTDIDAFDHNGCLISIIVSPNDCGRCHKREVQEFTHSHHARAGEILGSLDNFLGEVVEGRAAAVSGCKQCHGAEVKVVGPGKLDPETWPNTGMGRLNPDGSRGSCSACHTRHNFSSAQARQPENCGRCHLGPDHPQKEIYEESKHGVAYYGNIDKMNLNSPKWVLGEDYSAAPTCATCHMSATPELPLTHDVGDRISWTLRPAVSEKVDAPAIKAGKQVKPWASRRADMKKVCGVCHTPDWVESFYIQYDNVVHLYNNKFAIPARDLIGALAEQGLVTKDIQFDDEIEWTYYFLWHHEGRRARMGASMFAPDYTQWHGFYEVADRFYMSLIPQAKELVEKARHNGKADAAKKVEAEIDKILNMPDHQWFLGKMPLEEKAKRTKAAGEFKKRYAQ
ncbi:MAG: hydroxylamine oxidoreductase [Calditrichaeota bacterium]|nr:hydroxylamine oxidoreductase [Calditrichota bacterium]